MTGTDVVTVNYRKHRVKPTLTVPILEEKERSATVCIDKFSVF